MNVITGYFRTFKVIQCHIFRLKSNKIQQNVYSVMHHRFDKYKNDKPNIY